MKALVGYLDEKIRKKIFTPSIKAGKADEKEDAEDRELKI